MIGKEVGIFDVFVVVARFELLFEFGDLVISDLFGSLEIGRSFRFDKFAVIPDHLDRYFVGRFVIVVVLVAAF